LTFNSLITLAAYSRNHNVMIIWHVTICLSVPSAYSPWLAIVHFGPTIRKTNVLVEKDKKLDISEFNVCCAAFGNKKSNVFDNL